MACVGGRPLQWGIEDTSVNPVPPNLSPGGVPPSQVEPDSYEAARNRQKMLVRLVRLAFLVIFVTVTLLTMMGIDDRSAKTTVGGIALAIEWKAILFLSVGLAAIFVFIDLVTPERKVAALFSIFFGLLAAMLATAAMSYVVNLLATIHDINSPNILAISKLLAGLGIAYLCVTTVLQTQDDFRLVIPYVEFAKQLRGPRPMILDTSALIDGRIVELCATSLLQSPIVIPQFVIAELQTLSDSHDKLKRARGRRGLDVVQRLQRAGNLDVSIDQRLSSGAGVDAQLIELAKDLPGILVTTDFGLTRVASIASVRVANLNDVSTAMRPALAAGDPVTLRLIKPGEQAGQGVGYLEDGTMVVAEDGGAFVGQVATLVVTSTLQTSAGRLIFARVREGMGGAGVADGSGAGGAIEGGGAAQDVGGGGALPAERAASSMPSGESGDRHGPVNPPRVPGGRPSSARNPRR